MTPPPALPTPTSGVTSGATVSPLTNVLSATAATVPVNGTAFVTRKAIAHRTDRTVRPFADGPKSISGSGTDIAIAGEWCPPTTFP
jgi:hypothetical protein